MFLWMIFIFLVKLLLCTRSEIVGLWVSIRMLRL